MVSQAPENPDTVSSLTKTVSWDDKLLLNGAILQVVLVLNFEVQLADSN